MLWKRGNLSGGTTKKRRTHETEAQKSAEVKGTTSGLPEVAGRAASGRNESDRGKKETHLQMTNLIAFNYGHRSTSTKIELPTAATGSSGKRHGRTHCW